MAGRSGREEETERRRRVWLRGHSWFNRAMHWWMAEEGQEGEWIAKRSMKVNKEAHISLLHVPKRQRQCSKVDMPQNT